MTVDVISTLERSKTVDEEISAKVIDFLDRNDPKKTNKPFFIWYNPARKVPSRDWLELRVA
jgi:hypothetical protein